jgi:signal transduction histidine kinase/ligand-binding sensor domain-containing protein
MNPSSTAANRTRRGRQWLAILLLAAGNVATADSLVLRQMDHTAWTKKDGAPAGINQIAEALDGTLWLASKSGLIHFDGIHFNVFQPPPGEPQFPAIEVARVCISRDGTVWIGFWLKGIASIRNGHVRMYTEKDGLPPGGITQILEGPDGSMWTIARRQIRHLVKERWIDDIDSASVPLDDMWRIFFDREGTQWIAANKRIYTRRHGETELTDTGQLMPSQSVAGAFVQTPDGSLWFTLQSLTAAPGELRRVQAGNAPDSAAIRIPINPTGLLVGPDGALWVLTDEDLSKVVIGPPDSNRTSSERAADSVSIDHYSHLDGLSAKRTVSGLLDRAGNVWVATTAGLDRLKQPVLTRFVAIPIHGSIAYLARGANRQIWIAAGGTPLISVDSGQKAVVHGPPRDYAALYCDANGIVWLDGADGFMSYDSDHFLSIPYPGAFPPFSIHQMTGRSLHRLFVSFIRNGLWMFSDGTWTRISAPQFPDETPMSILEDSKDRLWAGFVSGDVVVRDGASTRSFSEGSREGLGSIQVLTESKRGLFVGATNGLAVIRGDGFQVLRTEGGLASRGVSGIVETKKGDLWINSSNGIFQVSAAEVEKALQTQSYRMRAQPFLLDDLPLGGAPQISGLPSAIASADERLWFSAADVLVSMDPNVPRRSRPPPSISIRAIGADEDSPASLDNPRFGSAHTLRIDYFGADLTGPNQVVYRYKLDNVDPTWQEVGARTEAVYTELRPGQYTFRVAASNGDGIWNERAAALQFAVLPAFYQTVWFRVLALILAVAAVWGAFGLRLRYVSARVRERSDERANERVRIARDLHDTLLQGIQGLMLRFHFAAQKVPNDIPARRELEDALSSADRILLEGRQRVKLLRDSSVSSSDLADSLAATGKDLNWNEALAFQVQTQGPACPLRPDVQEELFTIGREALTNAFRHSQASKIEVVLSYTPTALHMSCRDNGSGIPTDIITQGAAGHWGLLGMRERAIKIGATLDCWSAPGSGTEISVAIAARRAYVRPRSRWFFSRRHIAQTS